MMGNTSAAMTSAGNAMALATAKIAIVGCGSTPRVLCCLGQGIGVQPLFNNLH